MDRRSKIAFAAHEQRQEQAAYSRKLQRDLLQDEADEDEGAPLQSALRGQLTDVAALRRYLEAGRAIFTIRSKLTGTRFTFRAARPKPEDHEARQAPGTLPGRPRPIWFKVLTGPENTTDYAFVGTAWPEGTAYRYAHSPKSQLHLTADSVKALRWLLHALSTNPALVFQQAEIWHEGRCGRCGRRLTVPESISTGFGPECAGIVGLS